MHIASVSNCKFVFHACIYDLFCATCFAEGDNDCFGDYCHHYRLAVICNCLKWDLLLYSMGTSRYRDLQRHCTIFGVTYVAVLLLLRLWNNFKQDVNVILYPPPMRRCRMQVVCMHAYTILWKKKGSCSPKVCQICFTITKYFKTCGFSLKNFMSPWLFVTFLQNPFSYMHFTT